MDFSKVDMNILYSLLSWVWRFDRLNVLKFDFEKGLFLYGSIGRGKTLILRALCKYLRDLKHRWQDVVKDDYRLGTKWVSASVIANDYAADGQPYLKQYYSRDTCLFIDEMGREPNPSSYYGTRMNVLQFILQMRYDGRHSSVTHVSTNLSLDMMAETYGDYVADRCLEMFNFVEFSGPSLRQ